MTAIPASLTISFFLKNGKKGSLVYLEFSINDFCISSLALILKWHSVLIAITVFNNSLFKLTENYLNNV